MVLIFFFPCLVFYRWSWEARLLRGNLKPSMANLMYMRVSWEQPNKCQVNMWFKGWLCRGFCSFVLFLPWRQPEGWNTSASFKLAFSFAKNFLIMNIAGFLLGFWSVHWRGLFVSPSSSVSVLVELIFFTCIPFHYFVFIKITFFLLYGGYIFSWARIMHSVFPELFALETSSWYNFEVEGERQLHWKLENTTLKPHLEFLDC